MKGGNNLPFLLVGQLSIVTVPDAVVTYLKGTFGGRVSCDSQIEGVPHYNWKSEHQGLWSYSVRGSREINAGIYLPCFFIVWLPPSME